MARFQTVDLSAYGFQAGRIEVLRAEVPTEPSPFALIRYSVGGKEQPQGLRLDVDKRAFLDQPGSPEESKALTKAAPEIAAALREALSIH